MELAEKIETKQKLGEDYPFRDECQNDEEYDLKQKIFHLKHFDGFNHIFASKKEEFKLFLDKMRESLYSKYESLIQYLNINLPLIDSKKHITSALAQKLLEDLKKKNYLDGTFRLILKEKYTFSSNFTHRLVIIYSHQSTSILSKQEFIYMNWEHYHESHFFMQTPKESETFNFSEFAFLDMINQYYFEIIPQLMLNPALLKDFDLEVLRIEPTIHFQ